MKNQISLFSSQKINPIELLEPLARVLHSHHYILGQEVDLFEKEFSEYCGSQYCVSVANGTDALEIGLKALGVTSGDTVLLVANAAYYGSIAVRLIGATPHYLDVDEATLTMSVAALKEGILVKPKAIIVTHLYGQLADIEEIVSIATAADIPVLEDCAEAHGARRNGKLAGSFGAVGCFSFYPTKNLGALGDGGAIVTSDENILKRLKQLRQYGWGDKYHVDIPGGRNSRLDEMQAAVLREKLPHLDDWNEQRRNIAIKYNEAFRDLPMTLPVSMELDYVAHLYVVQVENRDSFREHMKACGVATVVHFPVPDHLQKAYECTFKQGSLPVTERACDHVVTLPCYPGMTAGQVESVIEAVRTWFKPMQLAKLG